MSEEKGLCRTASRAASTYVAEHGYAWRGQRVRLFLQKPMELSLGYPETSKFENSMSDSLSCSLDSSGL